MQLNLPIALKFEQVAKNNQSQKASHGMYNRTSNHILLVIARIFHPLTSHRTCDYIHNYIKY